MLNPPKEVPILKLCQHNWDKPNAYTSLSLHTYLQSQRKITQFLPMTPSPSKSQTIKSKRLRNVVTRLTHTGKYVLGVSFPVPMAWPVVWEWEIYIEQNASEVYCGVGDLHKKKITWEKLHWWSTNECACMSTPPEVHVRLMIGASNLSWYIPGSWLNTRNTRPYCNRQLLKISRTKQSHENLPPRKFFTQIIFNMKTSQFTV